MQKNSHAAADWFPKSTAECIGSMLNPKTKIYVRCQPGFRKNMMIRYAPLQTWKASQPPQVISLAVLNCIANEIEGYIIYGIDTDKCVTDLRFSRHIKSVTSLTLNHIFVYLSVNTEVLP